MLHVFSSDNKSSLLPLEIASEYMLLLLNNTNMSIIRAYLYMPPTGIRSRPLEAVKSEEEEEEENVENLPEKKVVKKQPVMCVAIEMQR